MMSPFFICLYLFYRYAIIFSIFKINILFPLSLPQNFLFFLFPIFYFLCCFLFLSRYYFSGNTTILNESKIMFYPLENHFFYQFNIIAGFFSCKLLPSLSIQESYYVFLKNVCTDYKFSD